MKRIRAKAYGNVFFLLFFIGNALPAEDIRVNIKDSIEIREDAPDGTAVQLYYNDTALIALDANIRFLRAVELGLTAPQNWLPHYGVLAFGIYSNLDKIPEKGAVNIECKKIVIDPVPNKIQTIYQIPLRNNHGLRGTPYATLLTTPVPPADFPILFRLVPIGKGLPEEIETMRFQLHVKPVFSDEGVLKISVRRPDFLPNGVYTALIDDQVVENPANERLIREGEHYLTLLSSDYRTENRRFVIERGKTTDLAIILHDLTPLIIFEAPVQSQIFLDNAPVQRQDAPVPIEPGVHEVRFQVSDYAVIKTLTIEKGKTYRVAYTVDIDVQEL
jgi:hypothetical protein